MRGSIAIGGGSDDALSWGWGDMRTRITTRLLAWAVSQLLLMVGSTLANTVDIVHSGFGAHDTATVWGGGQYGTDVAAGVYTLNKTGDSGSGSTWHNGPIPGFCVELNETAPTQISRYGVGMPEDMVNSYTGGTVGTARSNYLRELWARYYDPAWAKSGSTTQQNRNAAAFAAAVWEIVYEDVPSSPARWNVTTDGTSGIGGFIALNVDSATANKWLHSLGGGPKANLRVLTNNGAQNYLVSVPEPATIVLLGLGGLALIRRRRPQID
jgi:hypothetical protein